jgi:hypothetical protein
MKKHLISCLAIVLFCFITSASAQTIRYVKAGAIGSGSDWGNASGDLQAMINASTSGDQVWVAAGTYKPKYRADNMSGANPNDRDNAFVLKADVKVYGGFAGNESKLNQRDSSRITIKTILSGNIGAIGDNTDNTYHVVVSAGDVGTAEINSCSIVDGFALDFYHSIQVSQNTIAASAGGGIFNASSSPILTNVTFSRDTAVEGGGILNVYSSPILTNVIISGNVAEYTGGGISNEYSSPILTNVIISGNITFDDGGGQGGGLFNYYSSPVLTNVTISGNSASYGGGIYNDSISSPHIRNSIIYGNYSIVDKNSNGIFNSGASHPIITYSLVQGSTDESNGNISGAKNPQFVAQLQPGRNVGGNYRLSPSSPVIDKGNNSYLGGITTDLDGKARIKNGIVDMGAYEGAITITPTHGIVYVTVDGSGDFTGSSWGNATNDLQNAINGTNVQQVWVASGTYKPIHPADNLNVIDSSSVLNAFVLKANVEIYGGFAGTETMLTQRDSSRITNKTILSGELGATNNVYDNAYHVVISAGDVGTAEINGFSIVNGFAAQNNVIQVSQHPITENSGGGIYNVSSSPVLTNLTISGNGGTLGGGGIFNVSSSPVLTNVTISENIAISSGGGGGIWNQSSSPILTNVIIKDNVSQYNGGGMYNSSSSPLLTNVTISGNQGVQGGGIYNATSSPILTNVTISGNSGSGIYNDSSSSPQIRNAIIYGNSGGIINSDGTSVPVITYSLVQGSTDESNGNISGTTDPKFVQPLPPGLSAGGDYRLQEGSPVINKGNNALFAPGATPDLSAIKTDLDGKNRFKDVIDFGAYEYGAGELPVEVINYSAQAEGNNAKLKWTTATESNNKEFIISRSADGRNFKEIGSVAGAGNTSVEKNYVFYDQDPLNGINFYQLTQLDFDGHKTDVGVRIVNFSFTGNNLIKVYPNPVKSTVKIEFTAGIYHQADLTDVNGKVLQRLSLSNVDTEKKIDMSNMAAGIYFIKLSGNDKVESSKVVKE